MARALLILTLFLLAPPAADAYGPVGCPDETSDSGGVTASLFGGGSSGETAVSRWCPATGDTYTLTATCSGTPKWRLAGPADQCAGCTITPTTGANATLSGLSSLAPSSFVRVDFRCLGTKVDPGALPHVRRQFWIRTASE